MYRKAFIVLSIPLAGCASVSRDAQIQSEIRAAYDQLEAAVTRLDADAIIALRTPDFATIGPDGRSNDANTMADYTRRWVTMNKPPVTTRNTIQSIDVRSDDEATVTVLQEASRYQELAGKRRLNQHQVTQRETWVRTPAGWRLKFVDQVRDQRRWIDGKRVDPSKPYDPDAPEFVPGHASDLFVSRTKAEERAGEWPGRCAVDGGEHGLAHRGRGWRKDRGERCRLPRSLTGMDDMAPPQIS